MKEQLFVVREGDADYRWIFADFSQLCPNQHTYLKGILGSKVRQRKRLLLSRDVGKLFWLAKASNVDTRLGTARGELTVVDGLSGGLDAIELAGLSNSTRGCGWSSLWPTPILMIVVFVYPMTGGANFHLTNHSLNVRSP